MFATNVSSDGTHILRYKRLREGPYFADFRRDQRLCPEVYHCIVQREGSSEVLGWSQYRTLEEAIEGAKQELKRLAITNKTVVGEKGCY
jgi:hypothetical protein